MCRLAAPAAAGLLLAGCAIQPPPDVRTQMNATCAHAAPWIAAGRQESQPAGVRYEAYSLGLICDVLRRGECPLGMTQASADWVRDYAAGLRRGLAGG